MSATQIISDPLGRVSRRVGEFRLVGEGVELSVGSARFSIGSQPGNELVLAQPSVSRYHAEIVATAAGFLLRDLDSTNGCFIDGLRVREAYLPERCQLRLGKVELRFSLTGQHVALDHSDEDRFHGLVGVSVAMRELFVLLRKVAASDATVLIEGESGTGKELAARAIVAASARAEGPFVAFDCAAVPRSLIESELFGHDKGAFTGADSSREGCFEQAHGGTLFLDELGELPLDLQPKLLRALENREIRRLGSSTTRKIDVRLVAATNRDLAREVNHGTFRSDLYYRLAVVRADLPPLRERRDDVRPLAEHFVRQLVDDPVRASQILAGISAQNWQRLEAMRWPGNVRELRNFIERTLLLSDSDQRLGLTAAGLSPAPPSTAPHSAQSINLDDPFRDGKAEAIERFERAYLFGQLARHEHNVSAAARAAGLDRMNFKRLLKKYR
jgi:DNA-binding NtrC family response regulator